jgi:hypothetical protein
MQNLIGDILIEPERVWTYLPNLFQDLVSELQEHGLMDELVNSAALVLTARLESMQIPGAECITERAEEILQIFAAENIDDAFQLIVQLVQDPGAAMLSLVGRAEEIGIDGVGEAILTSKLQSVLSDVGYTVPDEVVKKYATTMGNMDFEKMQDQLETVVASTQKMKEPKDMLDWLWSYVTGSATSKALISLRGFLRSRCLPIFDLVSDILVAVNLARDAAAEDRDDSGTVTGSREGDAITAWVLLAVAWLALVLAVAVSFTRTILRFFRTGCGDSLKKNNCCDRFGNRICFCARRGQRNQIREGWWWLTWWWLILPLAIVPALVAAPVVVVVCELYLIVMHPDGSVPRIPFVASYENLREVTEAIFESLPQTIFQVMLVIAPVMAGGTMEWDAMLFASIVVSVIQGLRYYMLIKRLGLAYQRPKVCGKSSIVGELASVGDPAKAHVPFHLLLRSKLIIDYKDCGPLTESQCHEVGEALIGNKVLRTLTFNPENQLTAGCMREISNGLHRNRTLITLNSYQITGKFENFEVVKSHEADEHTTLIGDGDGALEALAEGLIGNYTLRELCLSSVIGHSRAIEAFATALDKTMLEKLELYFIVPKHLTDGFEQACVQLAEALAKNKALRSLSMRIVNMTEGCLMKMLRRLSTSTTLYELKLSDLPLTTGSARVLKAWLEGQNTTLQSVSVHTETLKPDLLLQLSEGLQQQSHLRCLIVTYTKLDEGLHLQNELDVFYENARKSPQLQLAVAGNTSTEERYSRRTQKTLIRLNRLVALLGSSWNAVFGSLCGRVDRNSAEDLMQQALDESTNRDNLTALITLLGLVQLNIRLDAVVAQRLRGSSGNIVAKAILKHMRMQSKTPMTTSSGGPREPYIGFDDCELDDKMATVIGQSLADFVTPVRLSLRKHGFGVGGLRLLAEGVSLMALRNDRDGCLAPCRMEVLDLSDVEMGWQAMSRLLIACNQHAAPASLSDNVREWVVASARAILCITVGFVVVVFGAAACWRSPDDPTGSGSTSSSGDYGPVCHNSVAMIITGVAAVVLALAWIVFRLGRVCVAHRSRLLQVVPIKLDDVQNLSAAVQELRVPNLTIKFPMGIGENFPQDCAHTYQSMLEGVPLGLERADAMFRLIQRDLGEHFDLDPANDKTGKLSIFSYPTDALAMGKAETEVLALLMAYTSAFQLCNLPLGSELHQKMKIGTYDMSSVTSKTNGTSHDLKLSEVPFRGACAKLGWLPLPTLALSPDTPVVGDQNAWKAICDVLTGMRGIHTIDLSGIGIGPAEVAMLAKVIPTMTGLSDIRLDKNPVAGVQFKGEDVVPETIDSDLSGLSAICAAMASSSISKFSLSNCNIGSKALAMLASFIRDMRKLTELDISSNDFFENGASEFKSVGTKRCFLPSCAAVCSLLKRLIFSKGCRCLVGRLPTQPHHEYKFIKTNVFDRMFMNSNKSIREGDEVHVIKEFSWEYEDIFMEVESEVYRTQKEVRKKATGLQKFMKGYRGTVKAIDADNGYAQIEFEAFAKSSFSFIIPYQKLPNLAVVAAEAMGVFFDALAVCSISVLDISNTGIGPAGLSKFAEMLTSSTELRDNMRKLNLSKNRVTDYGAEHSYEKPKKPGYTVTRLARDSPPVSPSNAWCTIVCWSSQLEILDEYYDRLLGHQDYEADQKKENDKKEKERK